MFGILSFFSSFALIGYIFLDALGQVFTIVVLIFGLLFSVFRYFLTYIRLLFENVLNTIKTANETKKTKAMEENIVKNDFCLALKLRKEELTEYLKLNKHKLC